MDWYIAEQEAAAERREYEAFEKCEALYIDILCGAGFAFFLGLLVWAIVGGVV